MVWWIEYIKAFLLMLSKNAFMIYVIILLGGDILIGELILRSLGALGTNSSQK